MGIDPGDVSRKRSKAGSWLLVALALALVTELLIIGDDVIALYRQDRIPYALMAAFFWTLIVTKWYAIMSASLLELIAICGTRRQAAYAAVLLFLGLVPGLLALVAAAVHDSAVAGA